MIHAVTCVSFREPSDPCLLHSDPETLKTSQDFETAIARHFRHQPYVSLHFAAPPLPPKKEKIQFLCSLYLGANRLIPKKLYAPALDNYLNKYNLKGPGVGVQSLVVCV